MDDPAHPRHVEEVELSRQLLVALAVALAGCSVEAAYLTTLYNDATTCVSLTRLHAGRAPDFDALNDKSHRRLQTPALLQQRDPPRLDHDAHLGR